MEAAEEIVEKQDEGDDDDESLCAECKLLFVLSLRGF